MGKEKYSIIIIGLLLSVVCFANTAMGAFSPSLSSPAQTEKTITLSWTTSDDWIFSKYEAFYSTSVNGPWHSFWSTTDKEETTTYIGGLSPNTDYYFKVEDTGSIVGTTPSNTLQVRTKANPQLEITSNTMTTASLKWTVYNKYSSQVPFKSYTVQMRTSGGSWSTLTTSTDMSQNTYTVTGLSPGTYEFLMIDKVGSTGQYSTESNIATLFIPEPTTEPSNDTILGTSLSWAFLLAIVVSIALVVALTVGLAITRKRKSRPQNSQY